MANLLPGSTIDGFSIWHSGNLSVDDILRNPRAPGRFFIQDGQTAYGSEALITLALGDADTGFKWITDGNFALVTNGAERVRFTSGGQVGVGTGAPSALLHVAGTARVDGNAVFSTLITLPSAYGSNTIKGGTGDNATYATHNVRMQSWWGVGFEDHSGAVNGVYDARTGTWKVKGGYAFGPDDEPSRTTTIAQDGEKTILITNTHGFVEIGPKNGGAAHLYTDRPYWAMNKPLVAQTHFQLGDGSQTLIGLTNGTIGGQAIVLNNDARLKPWGNLGMDSNSFLRGGKPLIGSDGSTLFLNQTAAHSRVIVDGPTTFTGLLTPNGGIRWDSTVNPGSDYAQISYQSDNNTYALHGDSNENGTLIIEAGNDTSGAASADVIVLKSSATVVDGGVGSRLRVMNPHGFVDIGAQNTGAMHFITGQPFFYFNKDISAVGSIGVYGSSTVLTATTGTIGGNRILHTGTTDPGFVEGARTIRPASGDLNALTATGVYDHPAPVNGIASDWTYVLHLAHRDEPNNWGAQIAQHFHSDGLKVRRKFAGTWGAWHTIWTSATFNPDTKANLDSPTFSGTVTLGRTVQNADSIRRRGGHLGMIQHMPEGNGAVFAFETVSGQEDWQWANQIRFEPSGQIVAPALSTTAISLDARSAERNITFTNRADGATTYLYAQTAGGGLLGLYDSANGNIWQYNRAANTFTVDKPVRANLGTETTTLNVTAGAGALNLRAGNADHTYLALFPRTANAGLRGAFIGFPTAGSDNLTFTNELSATSLSLSSVAGFAYGADGVTRLRVAKSGDTEINGRTVITAGTGAQDAGMFARANIQLTTTDGSNPAVAFRKNGVDAVTLTYRGGNELYLQYTDESRLWHSGNLDPATAGRLRVTTVDMDTGPAAYPAGTMFLSDYTPGGSGIPDGMMVTATSIDGNHDGYFQLHKGWGANGALSFRNASGTGWAAWRTLWDTANFNPSSKADTTDPRLQNWGLFRTNGGQDFLGRGGRIIVASDGGNGAPGTLYLNYAGDFTGGVVIQSATQIGGSLTAGGPTILNATLLVAGASTLQSTLLVTGHATLQAGLTAGGASSFQSNLTVAGTFTANSTGVFQSTVTASDFLKSSRRELKQDITPYEQDALSEIGKLDIVNFRYRNDPATAHIGIIADDTENTLISGEGHDHFNTANTVAMLIRAVQQLTARVAELEGR
ncbi:tail fiber domain-containing protein [Deinococcus sp. 6YEL10]|uniref:tail fiber protein n=1 Tax=Deinococcus sp. 6YEL10 TaxID=2745870 RepID=UPI001E485425|nr:tail fiber protein [Deinococcus sp. 6YEL10]MCD0159724.1 tail fiber domain-containing protein [Deinococcus sp. 6YEL10]